MLEREDGKRWLSVGGCVSISDKVDPRRGSVKEVERLMVANTSGQINVRLSYKAQEKGKQMKPGGKKKERGRNRPLTPCLLWKQGRIFVYRLGGLVGSFFLWWARDKVEPVRKSRRSLQYRSRSYVRSGTRSVEKFRCPSVLCHDGWLCVVVCCALGR